ncbi:methyltransferase domain-containing protein [Plastoroseomonas arctica]|uniref:Methyltransferase domain-containing protein n=1 Tax=Plastoroseomonas arctica TaxID=1509237 RepID=A0AAF1KM48_9PROT|nr:methyltransferase domain-containing protein [Plastoroseomonas arctica]MBR0655766.1 methyltransferase domain-containing protein [Plastoroseomonas arctica]
MARRSLGTRSDETEWMDDATQTEAAFRSALRDLEFLNRISFGYRPTLHFLDRLVARTGAKSLSVLDVGAGGGDMLRRIHRWGGDRGIAVALTGLDRSPAALLAARDAGTPGAWISADLFDLPADARYDVVISALFTHHLPDAELVRFLGWMAQHAAHGWMINDLHRHPVPWLGLWCGTRLLRLDPMVVHDSTISVARAFTRRDWQRVTAEAGVAAQIRWQCPFRWAVSAQAEG